MSGIAGIVRFDRAPLEVSLLRQMTDALTYRGPDRQGIYFEGHVGMGHTLLATHSAMGEESQPLTLDRFTIVADARLDDRENLIQQLQNQSTQDLRQASDGLLILLAYQKWGRECPGHLLGDFAFVIWDAADQRLFCARDPLGVRPLYYSQIDGVFIFASDLNAVRLYPGVGDKLSAQAIGDYLVYSYSIDGRTSIYDDISMLPAAHWLAITATSNHCGAYWKPGSSQSIRYRQSQQYIEHFRDLFGQAVRDRLRGVERASIMMSGGLDSTSVAATLIQQQPNLDLRAFTLPARHDTSFALQFGDWLGITTTQFETDTPIVDVFQTYPAWPFADSRNQQPNNTPWLGGRAALYPQLEEHSRVGFTGLGGDALLYGTYLPYHIEQLKKRKVTAFVRDVVHHLRWKPGMRGLGLNWLVESRMGLRQVRRIYEVDYPEWIDADFAASIHLKDRVDQYTRDAHAFLDGVEKDYGAHSAALLNLRDSFWAHLFDVDYSAPGGLELRHPLFDVRLIDYVLSIPPAPWSQEKLLLRRAMARKLPDYILNREKTTVSGDVNFKQGKDGVAEGMWAHRALPLLAQGYVDQKAYEKTLEGELAQPGSSGFEWLQFSAPTTLEMWLQQVGMALV